MKFELLPKQAMALRTPATEVLYGGSAGAGKSYLLRVAAIVYASMVPNLVVYLFRRTFPQLWANHMEGVTSFWFLLSEHVANGLVTFNGKTMTWLFSNGSIVKLCHCQHEKDVWMYQGQGPHVLLFDESTHFPPSMYLILRSFMRVPTYLEIPESMRGLFPRIINATNPRGVGMQHFKKEFVVKSKGVKHIWEHKEQVDSPPVLRQFIAASRFDNPYLDSGYEDRILGMGDDKLARAMLDGSWEGLGDLYFSDVWDEDTHFIPPFVIPRSWYVDRSFDWGFSSPYSVGWWAQSDGTPVLHADGSTGYYAANSLFRIGELYGCLPNQPNVGVRAYADVIASDILEYEHGPLQKWVNGNIIKPGPSDTNIWDDSVPHDDAAVMREKGINWERAIKSPGSRVMGWRFLHNMMRNSMHSFEKPGFYVFNNCLDFKRTISELPRDIKNEDDVDTNSEDHIADETRYRVLKYGAQVGSIQIPN